MSGIDRFLRVLDCGPASDWEGAACEVLASADAAMGRLGLLLANGGRPDIARLASARRDASNTLRRFARRSGTEASPGDAWDRASSMVSAAIMERRKIDLGSVDLLAATVRGESIDPSASRTDWLRNVPMKNADSEYAPAAHVEALHEAMGERLLSRLGKAHPIVEAALATRWLVTVHPYRDGNGRTSRLLADWILGAAGYVPASYANPVEAFVACRFEESNAADPLGAIRVVARGVERSVALLERTATAPVPYAGPENKVPEIRR